MKNINWLLLLELCFVLGITCNNILSKFSQNGYKVKDVRMESMSYNKKYYNSLEIKTFKHNRTTPAINVTFNLKVATKDKTELLVQVYKFLSNEYRHFPIRFQVNLKEAADSNIVGIKDNSKKCGNAASFIFEKNVTYYLCNFVVDETRLPPLIPNGRFKIDLYMLYLNEEMSLSSFFWEIYTPIEYPKN